MLILLFVVSGAIFLMSTNDLVSIFLSIELQSYGLYLLSTIYRNSELATTGGLMYFLLGARGIGTPPRFVPTITKLRGTLKAYDTKQCLKKHLWLN